MGSVWIATIRALLNRCVDLAANVQRGDEENGTYLIVMCGASVVCGNRTVPGAQSSVTYGPFVRAQDRLRFCGVTYSSRPLCQVLSRYRSSCQDLSDNSGLCLPSQKVRMSSLPAAARTLSSGFQWLIVAIDPEKTFKQACRPYNLPAQSENR